MKGMNLFGVTIIGLSFIIFSSLPFMLYLNEIINFVDCLLVIGIMLCFGSFCVCYGIFTESDEEKLERLK